MTHRNSTIVQHFAERLPKITAAALQSGRNRSAETAQQLSRKGAMKAAAELCNAAMSRLINLLYEVDDTGLSANVDTGGKLLIPVPWGGSYTLYGLRATEAAVLASHIRKLGQHKAVPPLLVYDPSIRSWLLNVDYETHSQATAYWQRCQLSAGDYLSLLDDIRNKCANGRR